MEIDIRTLIIIVGLSHLIQVLIFAHQYLANKYVKGPGWWLLWSAAEIIGFIFILMRGNQNFLPFSIIFQDVIILSGTIFIYIGIRQFFEKNFNLKFIIPFFFSFVTFHLFFYFVKDEIYIRVFFLNMYLSVIAFLTAISIFNFKTKSIAFTANFNSTIFILHGSLFAYRTAVIISGHADINMGSHSFFNIIQYFDAIFVALLWTFGFIITLNQRLNSEIKNLNQTLEQRVSDRRRQLDNTNKELTFHLDEIEQFTYIATHDLQEPLRTITNFSELIRDEYSNQLNETGNKYLNFILNSTNRMKDLVIGLMNYSLIGKESVLKEIDCTSIANEALSGFGKLIETTKAEIKINNLPIISGFENDLKLLFHQLIDNALKFQEKGNRPNLTISAENQGTDWMFKFQDNGIGFEMKNKHKIFVTYKQLHNRNEFSGIGMGLTHCKKIVELHKGKIWAESIPGKGSVFYFTIPRK